MHRKIKIFSLHYVPHRVKYLQIFADTHSFSNYEWAIATYVLKDTCMNGWA